MFSSTSYRHRQVNGSMTSDMILLLGGHPHALPLELDRRGLAFLFGLDDLRPRLVLPPAGILGILGHEQSPLRLRTDPRDARFRHMSLKQRSLRRAIQAPT